MTSTTSTTPDSTATESLDIESLDAALHAADLRVLVACLFHLTGDERWLADDLRPRRDVRLIADPSAGYDDETAAMIRSEVREWLLAEQATPVILDPGPERFGEMLSFFLGEQVPPEYEPMVRHDFGFDASPATSDEAESTAGARRRVIIVGSGVSGLCLAHRLDEAGFDWHIVEKNPDLGGTWFDNRYPGCGVDTPNHFYSFSFASNPDWTHYFSAGDELREYLQTFAANRSLRDLHRVGASVTAAEWDAERNQWSVTIESPTGTRVEDADVVVTATGHFNQPVSPTFAGTDEFEGEIVHGALARRPGSDGQAGGGHRHRGIGDAVGADHRRFGGSPHHLPAHASVGPAGARVPPERRARGSVAVPQRADVRPVVPLLADVALRRRASPVPAPRSRLGARRPVAQQDQ
ncbi:MAG: NAD(P)/FAD-dependent oxidoreductase [Acidimicrobiales bacterium]